MKKVIVLTFCLLMAACGAIGIGSNSNTMIYNNSTDTITVSADSGVYKIKPESSLNIQSKDTISIHNPNSKCSQPNIMRKFNTIGVILDVIFGIIPVVVDAASDNLHRMPSQYSYSC